MLYGLRKHNFYCTLACLCTQSVILLWRIRPSVCPSHPGIVSKLMHILPNPYHLVGAWLVFLSTTRTTAITKFQGKLLQWGIKYKGVGKVIFVINHHLCWKLYKISPWLLWITSRKWKVVDRFVLVPVTFKGGKQEVKILWPISISTAKWFDLDRRNSVR